MNGNSTVSVVVEPGGDQVVAHVGLHALGALADRLGLPQALSAAMPWAGAGVPVHDRGKVLTQALLMLAGGGESCADIEHLRAQPALFGPVPSDTTLYRTMRSITPTVLQSVLAHASVVREQVWARSAATSGGEVVLDIDASLVDVHSENKQNAAPTYKFGFGFHPMFCFADATGEALAGLLRPGNAGSTTVADHVAVLDAAIAQLPAEVAVGHHPGNDPVMVRRPVRVRTDSGGCSANFAKACRARNIGFSVVARTTPQIHAAISRMSHVAKRWTPALTQTGAERPGAAVAEITDLVNLGGWPTGTRLILRREPLHPGAQRSLFPSLEYRYWAHYTDSDADPVTADVDMRAHAHVEDHIRRLKDSGLERFPFVDFDTNQAWLNLVCLAADLVRWFQLLCLTGPLAVAEPKRLRWALWHAPGRLVHRARRRIVRIIDGWPEADQLLAAYQRLRLIT